MSGIDRVQTLLFFILKISPALHILERKTKNSIEDIKHVAADVGEKLKPHVEHAKEVAHDGLEKIKPGLEKAGAAVSGSVHNAVDKVKEAVGK